MLEYWKFGILEESKSSYIAPPLRNLGFRYAQRVIGFK